MNLFSELKHRNVFRVGAAYLVIGWLLLQIADVLLGNFGAPAWVFKSFTAVLALGLPVALFLAWAFELTPEGVRREEGHSDDAAPTPRRHFGSNVLIVAGLIAIIGVLVIERVWFAGNPPDSTAQDVETTPLAEPEPSIAVLPFVNMSGNADNEYFSDGLTETLLHKLAQVAELKVAARTSSFAFKDQNRDIREIAAALGVANILEGSVQRAGDRVRITAQLIQADDGYHLWSQVFDRSLDDIFAVQDDIAVQVASALRGSLLDESAVAHDGGTDNTEAYDWYLRGRDALYDRNAERLADAVNAMRRAIALDPEFALAWSGLSEALEQLATFTGRLFDTRESGAILESARTAVRLAPDNVQARVRLAEVLMDSRINWEGWDPAGAREQLERALALDPDTARALSAMSLLVWFEGRFSEAVEYAERAMANDPLDWYLKVESVSKYLGIGKAEAAEQLARRIVDHNPEYVPGLQALGNVYWRTGRHVEAFRVYHRLLEINPQTAYAIERIGESFQALGDLDGAMRWLERAAALDPEETRLDQIDVIYLRGESDRAIDMLKRMIADRRASLPPDDGTDASATNFLERKLAFWQKDWETAYGLAKASLEWFESTDTDSEIWLAVVLNHDLALAADRLGRPEERDRALRSSLARIDQQISLGADQQYIWSDRAEALALLGDAQGAAEALEKAFERGFRSRLELLSDPVYEKVLDHPAMQAVLGRIAEGNREDRPRLLEVERELGDFAGEPGGVQETES